MSSGLRLLLIEDSDEDASLVIYELTRAGYDVRAERVETEAALRDALTHGPWDLAIADFTMPQFSGTAALTLVREHDAEVPFIFVSGTIVEDTAVAAMRTGAHDYIMKGSLKRLGPAVARELKEAANRVSRERAERRLAHVAHHDALTDLPNRVHLFDRLGNALRDAERSGAPLALIVLDLDGFKPINDSLGHRAGDRLLQLVSAHLRDLAGAGHTIARLGGDEFALLLPETGVGEAVVVARRVLERLRHPVVLDGRPLVVGGSMGIALYPDHGGTAETLLQKADIAMYVAKGGDLGFAVYAEDRDRRAHQQLALITELRAGIEGGQFVCDYQPIVDLRTRRMLAVEALARWRHPVRGFLPPSQFVELAEQTGLIEPLSFGILDGALAEWVQAEPRIGIPVAVNLSVRQLLDVDLPARIGDILARRHADPRMLTLEITETCLMSDPARSTLILGRLHDMGVKLAIDDFGTGYSSLRYLQQLPVDELKIDQSFIGRLLHGGEAIVRSVIDLAHSLNLVVVAEGVESADVRQRLTELGCDAAQGMILAVPGPGEAIRRSASGVF
jgi:diguanylate cyclase